MISTGHVKCVLTSQNGGCIKAIAFRVADNQIGHTMLSAKKDFFDVVGVLRHDRWSGRNKVQFIIEDIRRVYDE
jgi:single-stranded-DNA-specific exonuclease